MVRLFELINKTGSSLNCAIIEIVLKCIIDILCCKCAGDNRLAVHDAALVIWSRNVEK